VDQARQLTLPRNCCGVAASWGNEKRIFYNPFIFEKK